MNTASPARVRIGIDNQAGLSAGLVDILRETATAQGHDLIAAPSAAVDCVITAGRVLPLEVPVTIHITPSADALSLLAAVGTLLYEGARRVLAGSFAGFDRLVLSGVCIDLVSGDVSGNGSQSPLTTIERRLLRRLAAAEGAFVSRQTLEREVWGYVEGTRSRTVISTVHRVRAKIETNPRAPRHLLSDRDRGYRLRDGIVSWERSRPA